MDAGPTRPRPKGRRIRQSRASPRRRPVGGRDHGTEAPAFARRRVRAIARESSDASPPLSSGERSLGGDPTRPACRHQRVSPGGRSARPRGRRRRRPAISPKQGRVSLRMASSRALLRGQYEGRRRRHTAAEASPVFAIVDALQSNPPKTPGMLDLNRDRDDRLGVGLPAEHPALNPTQICLIDLDVARQPLPAGTHHRRPVAVQHRPRRLVGPQPQRPLNPQRRHSVLLAGHLPPGREPQPQRRPRPVEDRPGRNRHLTPADRTLPTTAAQPPRSPAHAPRAPEPVRPAQPLKVVPTRSLVRKPRQQLPHTSPDSPCPSEALRQPT